MRQFTANTKVAASQQYGHEPVILIQVSWASGVRWYADKDLTLGNVVATGRLVEFSGISSQRKQDYVGMVSATSFTLTDQDQSLKALIDQNNVEYTLVSIYQHFEGLAQADLSLLFQGYIAGPVEWSEGTRTFKFQVETKLKDQEVGFSVDPLPPPDPSNIYVSPNPSVPNVDPDSINKPWPLCFGDVVHVPALLLETGARGFLKYPFKGPRDPNFQKPTTDPYQDDGHFYLQDGDGAFFPQDRLIDLIIEGWVFRGTLHQDTFTVSEPNVPKYIQVFFGDRVTSDIDSILPQVAWLLSPISIINCWCLYVDEFGDESYFRCIRQDGTKVEFDRPVVVQTSGSPRLLQSGDFLTEVAVHGRVGWKTTWTAFQNASFDEFGFSAIQGKPQEARRFLQVADVLSHVPWKLNAGAEVRLWADFKVPGARADVWVANLIPTNAVVAVYCDKTNKEGVRELVPVPPTYYSVTQPSMTIQNIDGPVTVHPTLVTIDPPLREYEGQRWGEQVYVTLRSSQGPNTADVMAYLLNNYSSITPEPTSFASVRTALANYPSNFVLFDKPNCIKVVEEIAWQARCGIRFDQGYAQVVYLSQRPSSDITLAEPNVVFESPECSFTPTEDIFTRLQANMKLTYYPARRFERTFLYKKNVQQYGLRKKEVNWFIYNIPSLVQKSLAFWGPRYANSWRIFKARVGLEGLPLEVFDSPTWAFSDTGLLNGASIKSILDEVKVEGQQDAVSLQAWLPYYAGTTTEAPDAWMSDAGDVNPGDPTSKYLPTPTDLRIADEESRFRALTKILTDSGAIPSQVTNVQPNLDAQGNVDPQQPVVVTVDQYADGYDQPKTAANVQALPINPSSPPNVGDHVAVTSPVAAEGQAYVLNSGGGTAVFAAKVKNSAGAPSVYQVDVYGNGLTSLPTVTNATAKIVDLKSVNFQVNDQITVFLSAGTYYIISEAPFINLSSRPVFSAQIQGPGVGTGVYICKETVFPGGGLVPGAPTFTATEFTKSPNLVAGMDVQVNTINGLYWIFFPLGNNT